MDKESSRTFGSDFKRFFGRGLGILLPSVLTLWILVKAYQFVDSAIAQPINSAVRAGVVEVADRWKPVGDFFEPTPKGSSRSRPDEPRSRSPGGSPRRSGRT